MSEKLPPEVPPIVLLAVAQGFVCLIGLCATMSLLQNEEPEMALLFGGFIAAEFIGVLFFLANHSPD